MRRSSYWTVWSSCVCVFFCVVMARPLLQLQLGMFERFYCVSLLLRLWVRIWNWRHQLQEIHIMQVVRDEGHRSSWEFRCSGCLSVSTAGLTKRSGLVQAPGNGGSRSWSSNQEGKHRKIIFMNFPDLFFQPKILTWMLSSGRLDLFVKYVFFHEFILNDSGLYVVGYCLWVVVSWDMQMHPQGPLRKSKEMQCRPRGPEKVNPFKVCLFLLVCIEIPMLMIFMWGTKHYISKMIAYHPDWTTYHLHGPIQKFYHIMFNQRHLYTFKF